MPLARWTIMPNAQLPPIIEPSIPAMSIMRPVIAGATKYIIEVSNTVPTSPPRIAMPILATCGPPGVPATLTIAAVTPPNDVRWRPRARADERTDERESGHRRVRRGRPTGLVANDGGPAYHPARTVASRQDAVLNETSVEIGVSAGGL